MTRDMSTIPAGMPVYGFLNPNQYAVRGHITIVGGFAIRDIESDDMYAFWGDMFRVDADFIEISEDAPYDESVDSYIWNRRLGTVRQHLIDAVRDEYENMRSELVEQIKLEEQDILPYIRPGALG